MSNSVLLDDINKIHNEINAHVCQLILCRKYTETSSVLKPMFLEHVLNS